MKLQNTFYNNPMSLTHVQDDTFERSYAKVPFSISSSYS